MDRNQHQELSGNVRGEAVSQPGLPTIAGRLHLLVLASILPMWLVAVGVTYAFNWVTLQGRLRTAEEAGLSLARAVDADLSIGFSALAVLAESPLIDAQDWGRVYTQAASVRVQQRAMNVFLMATDMQVQVSLDRPFGEPLPRLPFDRLPNVFAQGVPSVSDRFLGSVIKEPLVSIGVPVIRQGRVTGRVEMVSRLARFDAIVARASLPNGWSSCLLDGQGQEIARSDRSAAAPESCAESRVSFPLDRGSWRVTMRYDPDVDHAQLLLVQGSLAMGALVLLGLGWLMARRMAMRIARPIQDLVQPALAIGLGTPAAIRHGGFRETHDLAQALTDASSLLVQRDQDRALAEAARRESDARLELALDAGGVGGWSIDPQTGSFWRSVRYDLCYGYADYRPGRTLEEFDALIHPDDRESVQRGRMSAIQSGVTWSEDYRITAADGSQRWLAVRARYLGDDPAQRCLLGVVADVTARRNASALALRRAELDLENRQLKEAIEQRSRFFAMMSHELRTPLNAVIGLSDILLQQQGKIDAEQQNRFLGHIAAAGRDLLSLVSDVLELGRAEAGRLRLQASRFHLREFCEESLAILRPVAIPRGIDLHMAFESHIEFVELDPLRLRQVLYNLLSNAIKYSPPGSAVTLRVMSIHASRLCLEVEDQGPGIPPDLQDRLFCAYEQLDNGVAMGSISTGLGLAVTRQVVELQGGRIGVRKATVRGSIFFVELPARYVVSER